jgi:uncharacterized protein YunC (DUF1805 family)
VINLQGTECEGISFSTVKFEMDKTNWYFCLLKNNAFEASCGPCNLDKVLQIFRDWAESCQEERLRQLPATDDSQLY